MSVIHHYTSLETLALILQNKTIRFNRLDRVDDLSEARAFGKPDLGAFLYVSCWTEAAEESLPQWHMYTNKMTGVRITLPRILFPKKSLNPPVEWGLIKQGELPSLIAIHHFWCKDYCLVPTFLSDQDFGRPVTYLNSLAEVYSGCVNLKVEENGKAHLNLHRVNDFAMFKKDSWSFQREFRFVLFALPPGSLGEAGPANSEALLAWPNHALNALVAGRGPMVEYIDIEVDDAVLSQIEVTLGPLAGAGHEAIAKALVEKHVPTGIVRRSVLTGDVRSR